MKKPCKNEKLISRLKSRALIEKWRPVLEPETESEPLNILKDDFKVHAKLLRIVVDKEPGSKTIPYLFITLDDLKEPLPLKQVTVESMGVVIECLPQFVHRKRRKTKKPDYLFGFYDKRIQYVKLFFRGGNSGRAHPVVYQEVLSIGAFYNRYFIELI